MNQQKSPLLSIGMIVKNEIDCLQRCLESLAPLREAITCELVIADTGSTDGTRELAAQYADVLFDFQWCNDFSAARNAVMDRCTGQWYLSLDADEYLDQDLQRLIAFLKQPPRNVSLCMVYLRNYTIYHSTEAYSDLLACRLARLNTGVRYSGAIHEYWPLIETIKSCYVIDQVVIHHTGYAYPSAEARQKKLKRNMPLLEAELNKEPTNLMRVLQCLESSYTEEQDIRFAHMGMQLVQQDLPQNKHIQAAVARAAVQVALNHDLPEFASWAEIAETEFPNSIYTLIDIPMYRAAYAYNHKNYEDVLRYLSSYWEGIRRFDAKEFDLTPLCYSPVYTAVADRRETAKKMQIESYRNLGQWIPFIKALDDRLKEKMTEKTGPEILRIIVSSWTQVDLRDQMTRFYQQLLAARKEHPEWWEKFQQDGRAYLVAPTDGSFVRPLGLFAPLDCDLGRVATILHTNDAEEAQTAAQSIEDWAYVPVQTIIDYMAFCLPFPESFYQTSLERMHGISDILLKQKDLGVSLQILKWLQTVPVSELPLEQIWRYDLLICALHSMDWTSKDQDTEEHRHSLLRLYYAETSAFLRWYYNWKILQQQTVIALPSVHRAGWLFMEIWESLKKRDFSNCIRLLRTLLHVYPLLNEMVRYMLDEVARVEQQREKIKDAPAELLELAEKIRTTLAQYPSDDPAVATLKQSEVYKKVAYLIEGMDVPVWGDFPQ
nr:glycosyltransferase family 2 protein [uncultured Agathobaculum sp.]